MQTTTPTSDAAPHAADLGEERAAWTVEALRSVWQRQHKRVGERIDVIDRAIAALAEDSLDLEPTRDATRAAHMLAGSVGMFGFLDASVAARELEAELEHPTPDRAAALSELLARVRRGVQEPVTLSTGP